MALKPNGLTFCRKTIRPFGFGQRAIVVRVAQADERSGTSLGLDHFAD